MARLALCLKPPAKKTNAQFDASYENRCSVGHSMRLEWDKNKAVLKWDKHLTCQGDVSVPLVTSQGVEQSNAVKAGDFRAFWAS